MTEASDILPDRVVREIEYAEPLGVFRRFADLPGAVFLDSALRNGRDGRYSFVAADPFLTLEARDGELVSADGRRRGDPFVALAALLDRFELPADPALPPFQGGAAGWLSYDLGRELERLPPHRTDDQPVPDLMLGCYDVVVGFDHAARRAWVVSSGLPETAGAVRLRRAQARLAWAVERLRRSEPPAGSAPGLSPPRPDLDRETYLALAARVVEHIEAGDIYQANLSHRFRVALPRGYDPLALYARLRQANPAPFGGFLRFGATAVVSASPERFLRLDGDRVETRPIKGTRPRGATPDEDAALAAALAASEKDRAENLMIVDLLRNDLSRVSCPHSVRVPSLFAVESYATVHHLVSTVIGRLRPEAGPVDLLRAAFPGGSITGAPKIRAMEILAALEPNRRGPYCGSVGWFGFDGSFDTSIAIRTIVCAHGVASYQVGGGIVADSDPESEYRETLDKGRALARALVG